MRILITNDDGIGAEGLNVLRTIAEGLSSDVWVIAPEMNQSGASHSMTLHEPMRCREVGERTFVVRGTPTDCVLMGVQHVLKGKAPDLILSVYYRHMIGTKILALPRLGAWNMHGSLLPKYRGRAPINWAVLHGEPRIGMTLHRMVKSADAGAIVDQEGVDLGPRDTAEQAFRKVLPCARAVLARQIAALLAGTARETPQDEAQAACFTGRKPEDGRIVWTQTSRQIFNLIRAVTDPYPGAFTEVGGAQLMVWWAEPDSPATKSKRGAPGEVISLAPLVVATGDGAIELTKTEWRGSPSELKIGDRLA